MFYKPRSVTVNDAHKEDTLERVLCDIQYDSVYQAYISNMTVVWHPSGTTTSSGHSTHI